MEYHPTKIHLAVLCPWLLLRFLGWALLDSKKLMGEYLTILTAAQFWAIFPLSQKRFLGKLFGVKADSSLDEVEGCSATSIVIYRRGHEMLPVFGGNQMNHGKMYGKLAGFPRKSSWMHEVWAPVSFFIIPDIWSLQPMHVTEDSSTPLSNEKRAPGWLDYIGDYTTQLYRDYNKPL